jgi:hypothetical protein
MGLLPLSYHRPAYIGKESFRGSQLSLDQEKSNASLRSGRSGNSQGIPDALAFDKIMSGGTCPVSEASPKNVAD